MAAEWTPLPATHLSARVTEEMGKRFSQLEKIEGKWRGRVKKRQKTTLNSRWKKDSIRGGNEENMCVCLCVCTCVSGISVSVCV